MANKTKISRSVPVSSEMLPVSPDGQDGATTEPAAVESTEISIGEGPWRAVGAEVETGLRGEAIERQSLETRIATGRALRATVPRDIHGSWTPSPNRQDPVAILQEDDVHRQKDLVALRYGRMSVSPFTFYRGAAAIMAMDLANTPVSGIQVQACGDCHLNNFGLYASPERKLLFDVNDFDETLPGPWEWDIKRLAASFVIGCRESGFTNQDGRLAAMRVCQSYRTHMREYAEMGNLDVWYSRVEADEVLAQLQDPSMRRRTEKILGKARSKDRLGAFSKLTEVVNGRRQFKNDPPVLVRLAAPDLEERIKRQLRAYARTLQHERRLLLQQYEPVDIARKVVGVGSVGTRCLVVLLEGLSEADPLFIQVKEAGSSVLEKYLPKSKYRNHGQRVVVGQRMMQAASDVFLGWLRADNNLDFYFRQLQDMKGSVDLATLRPQGVPMYADLCGWALARAHARSGERVVLAHYLGKSERFDTAIADFSEAYADQNERDYEQLMNGIRTGKIPMVQG